MLLLVLLQSTRPRSPSRLLLSPAHRRGGPDPGGEQEGLAGRGGRGSRQPTTTRRTTDSRRRRRPRHHPARHLQLLQSFLDASPRHVRPRGVSHGGGCEAGRGRGGEYGEQGGFQARGPVLLSPACCCCCLRGHAYVDEAGRPRPRGGGDWCGRPGGRQGAGEAGCVNRGRKAGHFFVFEAAACCFFCLSSLLPVGSGSGVMRVRGASA